MIREQRILHDYSLMGMKSIISFMICVAVMIITSIGCFKKEVKCISTVDAFVDSAQGPLTGTVNSDNVYSVFFGIGNGCGRFTGFEESRTGNIITVRARITFEGCMCTEIYQMANEAYRFRATAPGNYIIQFIKGDLNSVVQKNITVN